jgi:murein L,D-transpeptidase YafK
VSKILRPGYAVSAFLTVMLILPALLLTPLSEAKNLTSDAELRFITAIEDISQNRIDQAIEQFSVLTKQAPKFTLAKLIYADLLASRGGMFSSMGSTSLLKPNRLKALQDEARVRVLHHQQQQRTSANLIPKDLIQMTDQQPYAIVVDITLSRLFLFANDNGVPKLVKDYYASSGKAGADKLVSGDNKTPIGVYFITQRIDAKKLPSRYGSGALPLNYPNSLDHQQKRTGNGIWLHGSPVETYSRPPQASEGCISLTNIDFSALDKMVNIKSTPVIIGKNIEWITPKQWQNRQQQFGQLINNWKADWESLDNEQYIKNYAKDFSNGKGNLNSWSKGKQRVNRKKSFIKLDLENLSLFSYPDDKNLLVASFKQHYQSNNYNGSHLKRQYWRKEDDRWKVVYEGKPSKGRP